MNRLIVLPTLLLFASASVEQKHTYEDNTVKCMYELNQGRLNGSYISYYKNGKKKAEGRFENNYRTGTWTLWDSTGQVGTQRLYENPFVLKNIVPDTRQANTHEYELKYNADGCIEYFKLKEPMVVWAKKTWRTVSAKENPLLFSDNRLFNTLQKNIAAKHITAYSAEDDVFMKALVNTNIDTDNFEVIAYKFKEENFFDNVRMVLETRIIGICPVAKNKKTHATEDLYWVWYPEARKYLAQEKIEANDMSTTLKTMDDLFFFRCYSGQIYKEANVYDRKIADYKKGEEIAKEAESIEIGLIEQEHDLWMQFAKTK